METTVKIDFDTIPFVKGVNDLIAENYNTYKSPSRITSDYRGEVGITAAYNGRQILELLQNADDEGTDNVLIELDTKNNTLSVSNNGNPFTIEGIASLMIANNSVKKGNKKTFIGNKGLGFRSILNWTNSIEIITKEIILKFSPFIAQEKFEKIVTDKNLRDKLIDQEKPLQDFVPFAVLAIPELTHNNIENFGWQTSIVLNYKEGAKKDIINQLEALKPEILIFLNSIKNLTYSIDGVRTVISKTNPIKGDESLVNINSDIWNVKDTGEKKFNLDDKKYYQIKIGWKDDLSDQDTNFFTYFSTQVKTHFPCLIHASFELDPTRNHINDLSENHFVLTEITNVLCDLATNELQKSSKADWRGFRLLTPVGSSENKLLNKYLFYELLEKKKALAIYPCLDGKYRTKDEVVFYNNDFSSWITENGFEEYFPNVLLRPEDGLEINKFEFNNKISYEEFKNSISSISKSLSKNKINERVELITILLDDVFKIYHELNTKKTFPLLIDSLGDVISDNKRVFTILKGSIDQLHIPDFVNISFIDVDLRKQLEEVLKKRLDESKKEDEGDYSRALKRVLSPIVNIGSNDIIDVISTIINESNDKIGSSTSYKEDISKAIKSLFTIFNHNKERENILQSKLLLLNKKGERKRTNELFLSEYYPTGQLTEVIFEGIYSTENYLGSPLDFGFETTEDVEVVERFFLWLGVNKHIILSPIKFIKGKWENNDYLNFVFEKYAQKPVLVTQYQFEGLEILNLNNTFKNISPEKLILLISIDGRLKQKINEGHGDYLWSLYGQTFNTISCPSYIQFQIQTLFNFQEFLLDNNDIPFLNNFELKMEEGILLKHNIKAQECNYIISKLGAKLSFNELEIEAVYQYIKACKQNDTKHEFGRKLYLAAFNYFKSIEDADFLNYVKDYELLAEKDGLKEYRPLAEVYYSDNNTMPGQIISKYWIFDFPKRNGEEQIARYFGVKKIDSIAITIEEASITNNRHSATKEFNSWFLKIKPYLFAHRLNAIKTDALKKTNLASLKNVEIELVSSINYSFDTYNNNILLPGEYLKVGPSKFILCGEEGCKLESLKESSEFCEAFAEIICTLFLVSDKKDDYRAIFKDKNSLKDSQYIIKSKSLEGKLSEARILFGVSLLEINFWNAVLKTKVNNFNQDISQESELIIELKKIFGQEFELPENYKKVDFENFNNNESVDFLKWACKLTSLSLLQIKELLPDFNGIMDWYFSKFKNIFSIEELFGKALLLSLINKGIAEQSKFHTIRKTYNEFIDKINKGLSFENAYLFDVNYKQLLLDNLDSLYNINTSDASLKNISILNYYEKLLDEYKIEMSELSDDDKGLLYFKGHEAHLKAVLDNLKKDEETTTEKDIPSDDAVLPIKKTLIGGKNAPLPNGKKTEARPPLEFSKKREGQQKRAGKIAEKFVFNSLKKEYPGGKIQWLSGNSEQQGIVKDDSLGYDIRYTIDNSENWIFLEVKSVSNDSFIISSHEVYVAFEKQKMTEEYQLGLVIDGKIHIVEDFFNTDEWKDNFELIQGVSSIRPLDFEVFFQIDMKHK